MSSSLGYNCVICDVDGTIADGTERQKWLANKPKNWKAYFAGMKDDKPIHPVINTIKSLSSNYYIFIVSARPLDYEQETKDWLAKHHVPYERIYMRPKGDYRDDTIVKSEILDQIIEEGFYPVMVFDDRKKVVDMWISRGIFVMDVSQGKGDF